MLHLENMVVGRVYRVCYRGVSATDTEGWLWLWEGEDDGDPKQPWPVLKSLATGETSILAPMWLEAADEV
jgi:hypothetical protein